jgi:ElaA protein
MSVATPALDWRWKRFDALGVHELQNIYMARQTVFVVEQACAFLDADGHDEHAFHLAAWSATARMPLACARVLDPGVKYAEVSIGRVATTAAGRGLGLGRELMLRAIDATVAAWPGFDIRIAAQSRLEAFYASLGFVVIGERFIEDGIPHTEMLLPAPVSA